MLTRIHDHCNGGIVYWTLWLEILQSFDSRLTAWARQKALSESEFKKKSKGSLKGLRRLSLVKTLYIASLNLRLVSGAGLVQAFIAKRKACVRRSEIAIRKLQIASRTT